MSVRARVFISCGQRRGTDELEIAREISNELSLMGFDPYIAVEEQSLRGVTENIFRRLRESEYFLFIDFTRERLFRSEGEVLDTGFHRGSLFSHQELAIATFQDFEVLAFQEEGVKRDDGILRFIQVNSIPFSDRTDLSSNVIENVRERAWVSNWRNELALDRDDNYFEPAQSPSHGTGHYYHIKVRNLHKSKSARNCIAFIEEIRNLSTNEITTLDLVELKWKGVITEGVTIAPRSSRFLDALHVNQTHPDIAILGFNSHIVDWEGYFHDFLLRGPGRFDIDYVVYSDEFSPARATFRLNLDRSLNAIRFSST